MKYALDGRFKNATKCSVRAICLLAGGFLMHLCIGALYTFGNFSPYIISYLRNRTDDTSISNVDAVWLGGVGSVGNVFGMFVGGFLDGRFGPRIALLFGVLFYSGSVCVTYFTVQIRFIAMVITYGPIVQFGNKIVYGVPLQTAIKWFPTHPTLAVGLILAGYGGGATVFNQVITQYINPDNLSPDFIADDGERYFTDSELLDRVPYCFLLLGGCYLGIMLIGVVFISNPPATEKDQVDIRFESMQKFEHKGTADLERDVFVSKSSQVLTNDKIETISDKLETNNTHFNRDIMLGQTKDTDAKSIDICDAKDDNGSEDDITHKEAIKMAFKTRSFYIVWFTVLCVPTGMAMVGMFYKVFGQTFIHDDHFLALVGSMASVFNCIGRPFWGALMDRFGYKVTMRCICGGCAVMYSTLQLTENMPKGVFMLWICIIYFFYCGNWAVLPTTTAKLFGVRHMAINYGFIQIAFAISGLSSSAISSAVKPLIGWHGMFYMSTGITAVPFLLTFVFNGVDRKGKKI